jgi:vacuolar protein 8
MLHTRLRSRADSLCFYTGRSKVDYDNVLADAEREAVADLLNYLENVLHAHDLHHLLVAVYFFRMKYDLYPQTRANSGGFGPQRAETDFFSGEPLAALSTLVYSQNIDLQRSASLTFAEITERGMESNVNGWKENEVLTT